MILRSNRYWTTGLSMLIVSVGFLLEGYEMTTIKTQDLTGAALDWAVAMATEKDPICYGGMVLVNVTTENVLFGSVRYTPSTSWVQGGPLIEKFELTIHQFNGCAAIYNDDDNSADYAGDMVTAEGSTVLVASCRAIVAAKLGDEVDVPEKIV